MGMNHWLWYSSTTLDFACEQQEKKISGKKIVMQSSA